MLKLTALNLTSDASILNTQANNNFCWTGMTHACQNKKRASKLSFIRAHICVALTCKLAKLDSRS